MIELLPETGSTNADLSLRLARGEVAEEGDWLVADRQSAGRGRLGRAWCDGAGNFMGSTVVRLCAGDPAAPTLALVAGLAVQGVVSPLLPPGTAALLKWPNDLLVDGAKLAGILLERVGDAVVVGAGVNLAIAPEVAGRRTVALASLGPTISRDDFARALADQFASELAQWREAGLPAVISRWQAAAHPVGTPLRVGEPGEAALDGKFAGLEADGALRLTLPDGTTRSIHAGEVCLA